VKGGVIALVVVLTGALGVFVGRDAFPTTQTVAVSSPSPSPSPSPVIQIQTQTVTHTKTVPKTPASCRSAIDWADKAFNAEFDALVAIQGGNLGLANTLGANYRSFHASYVSAAHRCYRS
jgi:hypothetical protein